MIIDISHLLEQGFELVDCDVTAPNTVVLTLQKETDETKRLRERLIAELFACSIPLDDAPESHMPTEDHRQNEGAFCAKTPYAKKFARDQVDEEFARQLHEWVFTHPWNCDRLY